MMRLILMTILVSLPIWSANAWTYYVTKDGSDSDDGKSWANSWATIGKVNATLAAGDTVYFGTGTWYGASIMPPTGGDASNVTVYACSTMTPATRGLTIISGGEVVSTWTLHSGSVYKKAWTSAAGYYDAGAGTTDRVYTLSQNDTLLEPQTSIANVNASGEFFHDHVNDTLYIRCFGDVDPSSRTMVASNRPTVWFTATPDFSSNNRRNQDYLHFYGLDLRMGKAAVIYYWDIADGANDHNVYEQCNITRAGFIDGENPACIMVRAGFANPSYDSANINDYVRYVTVKNCSLGVCSYWEGAAEAHRGSGAIIYDGTNFVFDSTTFYQLASDGVEVKNSGSGDGQIAAQHTFRFCKFDGMGYNGVNIYTNAHRDSVYGCIFDGIYEAGVKIGQSSPGNDDRGDHVIFNNTFNECNIAFEVRPNEDVPRDYAPYTGEIKYNVVYNKVASGFSVLAEQYYPQSLAGATVPLDIWIDSNQYYDPSVAFVARWGNTTDRDWTYWWQTADNDSNGLNTDPGLNTTTFATTSAGTMNRTYGGQTWTVWGAIQPDVESCIVITALPDTLDVADTCYCLQDRKMSTAGNALLINARNVRLINRYGTRDTLDFGTDGGDNYEGLYITSKNVKVDGLYIRHYPTDPADSAANNICVFAVDADSLKVFRTKLFTAGTSGRGIQTNSGGFNIDLWRVTQDSSRVNSFISRTAHSANIFLMVPDSADGFTNYFFNAHACSVYNAPHNILATSDGPRSRPLVYIDSCDFSVDARNDFYTYDDHDNNTSFSSGDAFAIDVLGMGPGSRISYNRIRSGTAHEGGQGMLLQNLMGSSDDSIKIFGNDVDVSQGPNEIHGMGLCAGMYFRYVPGTENSGSQYVAVRNNTWKVTLDCDTATAYRGREGETWSLNISGFGGGVNDGDSFRYIDFTNNVVEQAFSGTPSGGWEGSAIGYGSADSADAAYNRNGHIVFANNHYTGVRQAVEIGNMRGLPGNRWTSIGDTIELSQDSDSAVCFDRTGTYTYHSRYNRIINAIYAGYADDANIRFDVGNGTSNDTLGEGISFWKTLTSIVTTCTDNTVVNGASYWVWNTYGDTVLTGTTGADGVITGLVNYKFEGYDKFADTYTFADSTYNDFTIKAKNGNDSVQVTMTVAAASLTQPDSLCFVAAATSITNVIRGICLQGVTIK